ncbi:hypothetical protein BH18ACI4_BH18ACI4_24200 [soil metagenome]
MSERRAVATGFALVIIRHPRMIDPVARRSDMRFALIPNT